MEEDSGSNTALVVVVVILIAALLAVLFFWVGGRDGDDAELEVDIESPPSGMVAPPAGDDLAVFGPEVLRIA